MNEKPSISVHAALVLQRAGAIIVDVRDDDEWAQGRVAGAVHIPMDDIAHRMDELPKGVDLLLICRSGRRSGFVQDALVDRLARSNVYNVEGGILAWHEAGLPTEHRKAAT